MHISKRRTNLLDFWIWLCALALLGLLATRSVHYAFDALPPRLDDALATALGFQLAIFANVTALVMLYKPIAATVLATLLLTHRWLLRRIGGVWRTHPLLHSVIWACFPLTHFFFDMNPYLAWGAAGALLLESPWIGRTLGGSKLVLGWTRRACARSTYFIIWMAFSSQTSEIVAIAAWGLLLVVLMRAASRLIVPRDCWMAAVGSVAVMQVIAALLPVAFTPPGATRLGTGMAYSFCEAPRQEALFAALPQCFTLPINYSWAGCKGGHLMRYHRETLAPQARHSMLSDRFYGRIEQLTCLENTIQIGMSSAIIEGVPLGQNAMSFEMSPPHRIIPNLVGPRMGDRLAFDRDNNALFYVGEWSQQFVRHDRNQGTSVQYAADPSPGQLSIMGASVPGSLLLSRYSIHRERKTIYFVEWLGGRYVQEMSLNPVKPLRKFAHNNGGGIGLTVDEDLDRIYVTGLWGMEVFDLATGRVIARRRLGFFSRVPVLDVENGLLYVPSTVEGKIRVFDRQRLDLLGVIPIGYGTRHPYLSADHKRFFASSAAAYYYWDATELARQFRARAAR